MHSIHWFFKHWEGLPFIRGCCQNTRKATTFSLGNSSSHHQKTEQKSSRAPKIKNNIFSVLKSLPISNTPSTIHTHTQSVPHGFFTFMAVTQFESPHWNDKPCILLKSQPLKSRDGKRWSYIIATVSQPRTVVGGELHQQHEQEIAWKNNLKISKSTNQSNRMPAAASSWEPGGGFLCGG